VLFFALLHDVLKRGSKIRRALGRRGTLESSVIAGYIFGMFVSGLGNGGVFLSYPFFFFAGVLAAAGSGSSAGTEAARPVAGVVPSSQVTAGWPA
jgi:hypothetical protein